MSKSPSAQTSNKQFLAHEKLIGLPSEICGFKDGVYYPPKSFSGLIGYESHCYNGLFYLLGDFQNSKDFKIYRSRNAPTRVIKNPLIIQIYISLAAIASDLKKGACAVFVKRERYSMPFMGNINFSKTITKGFGLQLKTYKTLNEFQARSLERTFLFYALKKLPSLIERFVPAESKTHLFRIIAECDYNLNGADLKTSDLRSLCIDVIRKPNERGPNSRLLSSCKVLSEFILQNSYLDISGGTRQEYSARQIEYTDFLLNLNRPFERLLQNVTERLPSAPFGEIKFSEIQSSDGKIKHRLIPDVYRAIKDGSETDNRNCLLIFDAKHKEFATLDSEFSESDMFTQYNRINRNDLHQLITYIRTNLVETTKGIFGFFGFIKEIKTDYEQTFVDCNRDALKKPNPLFLKISSDVNALPICINILGLRFGSLLAFIGEACNKTKLYPTLQSDIYDRLAIELANCLVEDEVVFKNQIYHKTLNRCLAGAARCLFHVYDQPADCLTKIGLHVLRRYLRLTGELDVKESKVEFFINSGWAAHVKIMFANSKALLVIDSSEDPMSIFDQHRASEIFEDCDVYGLLTRSGLAVIRNGNGVNPDTLI